MLTNGAVGARITSSKQRKTRLYLTGLLLPALAAGLIIIAALDIYRSRRKQKPNGDSD